ncbi:putative cyclin-like f-box protein [Rosellinia necatrix]|uniref:Putative cyclin-like f-box protein n=1 Tax=Rosellinia necatrix TaxID=77044 RepID=A0A1S8AAW2_ROSNE|nr:putative cyclin-like f-box protein [Rosellinia necatrix]
MPSLRSLFLIAFSLYAAEAAPQNRNGRNRNGNGRGGGGGSRGQQGQTAQAQADQVPQGVSVATDGSTILDTTAQVNGETVRFKVSAPADQFTAGSGVDGGAQAAGALGSGLGLNVLLHGDGGQSFFDFPNQAVQDGLAGVAVLAPDPNLFWGGGSGLQRTDGEAHAQIVNDLVRDVLPQVLAFDADRVSFTGVSGGSLLLSGFFMPAFMQNFASPATADAAAATAGARGAGAGAGGASLSARQTNATAGRKESQVLLNCGALAPQVAVSAAAAAALANTRLHFQSTQAELAILQESIPEALVAYERVVTDAGLGAQQVAALQTVDNSPDGGHCEFDERGFVSGVQLMADSFAALVRPGGDGRLAGTAVAVLNPVPGNERLVFSAPA